MKLNKKQKEIVGKLRECNLTLDQIHSVGSLLLSELSAYVADEKFLWEIADDNRKRIRSLEKELGLKK